MLRDRPGCSRSSRISRCAARSSYSGAGPHITFALTAILWEWLASCWAGVCHHALHPDQLSSAEEESV